MATVYTVQQGDHLSGIAQRFGFFRNETIWDHPKNAALKELRKDPHVLLPGDQLFVPDKEQKTESRATAAVHKFTIRRQTLQLRLALTDFDNEPIADTACQLEVEGVVFNLQSDAGGIVEAVIPATARQGVLRVPDLGVEYPVKIGELDPLDEESGWQARLKNLGYCAGPESDPDHFRHAIEEFQCDHGLTVSGDLDAGTRAKIKERHGV